MSISKLQRKDQILKALYEKGHLEVRELSLRFSISEATVRRDLRRLADDDLIELVYGGATIPRKNNFSIRGRQARNIEAKEIIGRLAVHKLVREGDCIFVESGSTCACMIPHLLGFQKLDVITNSTTIAAELGKHANFNVLLLGGKFRYERMDSVGPFAQMVIEQLSGYRSFIGADGMSMDFGLTCTDVETAHLYRSVINHASLTTVLVDHTKFSAPTLYKLIDLSGINCVITDRIPPQDWIEVLNRLDIDLIYPGSEVVEVDNENGDVAK